MKIEKAMILFLQSWFAVFALTFAPLQCGFKEGGVAKTPSKFTQLLQKYQQNSNTQISGVDPP